MDLIDFVHSINSSDIASAVTKYFEEVMILYNLLGYHDLDICADIDTSMATFTVLMESEKEAFSMYKRLNGSNFTVYGITYKINMINSGCSVKINMIRAA